MRVMATMSDDTEDSSVTGQRSMTWLVRRLTSVLTGKLDMMKIQRDHTAD